MTFTKAGSDALHWTPLVFSILVVSTRAYLRVKIRALGADDYLMLLALLWFLLFAILSQISANNRATLDEATSITLSTMASILATLSMHFGRTSVGCLLMRIFGNAERWQRCIIIACLAVLQALTFLALTALYFPYCPSDGADSTDFEFVGCVTPDTYLGFIGAWNFFGVFMDIVFSTIPITIVHKLNISRNKRVSIALLLGTGWIAAIFLLLRAISSYTSWSAKTQADVVAVATVMEPNLIMICGSLVTLTPLYYYWRDGRPIRPHRAPNYAGETKHPFLANNSISTVGGSQSSRQEKMLDSSTGGIHVERDFDVTSQRIVTSHA